MPSFTRIIPFFGFLALSCGEERVIEFAQNDNDLSEQIDPRESIDGTFIEIPIIFQDQNEGLSLASATAYSLSLDTCATGHTATVDETAGYLEGYEFDRNCLAKLTQFTLNSKVYTPKTGSTFTTWATGDTAVFEVNGASPADELDVEVLATLSNPVTNADVITYQFSELTEGSDETIGEPTVRESSAITVDGQAAPDFAINQVELVGITADGNGEFRFQFECNQTVTGTGSDITCFDVRLDSIYMAIGLDTYSGTPNATELDALFTAYGGGSQIDMGSEAFVAGGAHRVW